MEQRYFIDANVFLNTAQPERGSLYTDSIDFLERHQENCAVGVVVVREVNARLTRAPHEFRGKRRVMRYLAACTLLDDPAKDELIDQLQRGYAEQGWHGEVGDVNDRIHAATASAFGIPYLVTWEARFLRQQSWINEVNARYGLSPVQIIRPR